MARATKEYRFGIVNLPQKMIRFFHLHPSVSRFLAQHITVGESVPELGSLVVWKTLADPVLNLVGQTAECGWTDVGLGDDTSPDADGAWIYIQFDIGYIGAGSPPQQAGADLEMRKKGDTNSAGIFVFHGFTYSQGMACKEDGGLYIGLDAEGKFQYRVQNLLTDCAWDLQVKLQGYSEPLGAHTHVLS